MVAISTYSVSIRASAISYDTVFLSRLHVFLIVLIPTIELKDATVVTHPDSNYGLAHPQLRVAFSVSLIFFPCVEDK